MGPAAGRPDGSVLHEFFAQCRKACVGRKAPRGARDHGAALLPERGDDPQTGQQHGLAHSRGCGLHGNDLGRAFEVYARLHPVLAHRGNPGCNGGQLLAAGAGAQNPAHGHGLRRVDGYRRGGCGGGRHSVLRRGRHLAPARQHGPDSGRHCGPEVLFRLGGAKW